jgi:hypothetical protein
MEAGIYKISFVGCERVYIGQSINLKNRIKYHKVQLKKGCHYNIKMQRACNKYGFESIRFFILERFNEINTPASFINEREVYYISLYNSFKKGLNCNTGGGQYLTLSNKEVYVYLKESGCLIGKYMGYANTGRNIGLSESNIRQCCSGKLKSAKGYHFSLLLKTPQQVLQDVKSNIYSQKYKMEQSVRFSGINNPMYGKKRPEISGENNPYKKLIDSGYQPKRKIDYLKVIELYKSGKKQIEISEYLKCTQAQVSTILRANGVKKFNRQAEADLYFTPNQ